MRKLIIVALVLLGISSHAQDSLLINLNDVLELARKNHPIIKQAGLQDQFAEAEIRTAKGTLDPKITSTYNLKDYKDTEYWNKFYSALKIPVWFPIDPKIEAARSSGEYLNREDYIAPGEDYWQVSAGVSVPIGKGLFIDERRALIKQAKLYSDIAEAEKIKLSNKMLFTIVKSYWEWYFAYEQFVLMEQSMQIADEIFRRVKLDYEYGEAAVVDTVQAKITYQNRRADYINAGVQLNNSRLAMSIHLWSEEGLPLELPENMTPSPESSLWIIPEDSTLDKVVIWAFENHPEIQKVSAKQGQYEIEQQWNRESLKPQIDLSYSFIDAPFSTSGLEPIDLGENYKLGVDFSFPILLRKERGKLQKSKLQIESLGYELLQTQQQIGAQIKSVHAELTASQQLTSQYADLAANYQRLLDAEIFNIENGESDLFKLNIQQDKFIESQIKYLKVLITYQKLKAELPYVAGLPYLSYLNMYE
ncbi:TolC family protein [Marinoscillum sp.]|uniref:TolC family protein n=1 Tax=Marinoscillum sp. TaxID=2024838 RepID=UPI003BA935AE